MGKCGYIIQYWTPFNTSTPTHRPWKKAIAPLPTNPIIQENPFKCYFMEKENRMCVTQENMAKEKESEK